MAGSFLDRRVDQPVHFQAGMFALDGKLERVRLVLPDEGEREIVLTVWFDYWDFKRVDRGKLFGYGFDSLDLADGELFELVSTSPVQLELRAEGAAQELLAKSDGEALLDQAVAGLTGADTTSPLLDAASYRYLGVYQEKQVDGVTFLKGARSVFRRPA